MIAMLVIAAIGFILVAFVVVRIGSTIREEAGPQACLGALTAQNWIIGQLGEASASAKPWPRVCNTQDVTLEGETAPEVSQELIRLLSDCWYQMGSGRFSPFEADWGSAGLAKCFICNTFRAPNLQEPITDVQFNAYLKEISLPGSDESLYDTFNKDLTAFETAAVGQTRDDIELLRENIQINRYYSLMFFDVSSPIMRRWFSQSTGWLVNSPRDEGGVSKLYIVPLEESRECYSSDREAETGD